MYTDELRRLVANGWKLDEAIDFLNRCEHAWQQFREGRTPAPILAVCEERNP